MTFIKVTEEMKKEAREYAHLSENYTSRRHDFHEGGASAAAIKMYEGKIGEKAFRFWLDAHSIPYQEDKTKYYEADNYDFLINGLKIDVKTRTKKYHIRTLELVEQFNNRPKDIYVSTYYNQDEGTVQLLGFITRTELRRLNPIQNNGYQDNYVAYDRQLNNIGMLKNVLDNLSNNVNVKI